MTSFQPNRRRPMRLPEYDYAQPGGYFITIVTHDRVHLFGTITDGDMRLNRYGEIVQSTWLDLPRHYPYVHLDAFVVMPNHVHGILFIGQGDDHRRQHGLPEIVRGFKTYSARRINALRHTMGQPVWQRNYYEHILRNSDDLDQTRRYIEGNPLRWEQDQENS